MTDIEEKAVLKGVAKKFPVCNVIDARTYDPKDVSGKCSDIPTTTEVKLGKKKFTVTLCTGSFNVYVLKIEDKE